MSLFEKIKIRLTEVKKEPPIESGSVDPANQQGTFRKNERNKKKIMRKLSNPSTNSNVDLDSQQPLSTTKSGQGSFLKTPGKERKKRSDAGQTRGPNKKNIVNNPDQFELNLDKNTKEIVKQTDAKDAEIEKLDKKTIKAKRGSAKKESDLIDYKKKSLEIQKKSTLNKSKKYASGEYPRVGGGERKKITKTGNTSVNVGDSNVNIDPKPNKSKGSGTGSSTVQPNINPKKKRITGDYSQGTATKYTNKINRANPNRPEYVPQKTYDQAIKDTQRANPGQTRPLGTLVKKTKTASDGTVLKPGQIDFTKAGELAAKRKARIDPKTGGATPEGVFDYLTSRKGMRRLSQGMSKSQFKDYLTKNPKAMTQFKRIVTSAKNVVKNPGGNKYTRIAAIIANSDYAGKIAKPIIQRVKKDQTIKKKLSTEIPKTKAQIRNIDRIFDKQKNEIKKVYGDKVVTTRQGSTSIRGSASQNPLPEVKPSKTRDLSYKKILQQTKGKILDGTKLKNLNTRQKVYRILKQIGSKAKTSKNLKTLSAKNIAKISVPVALGTYGVSKFIPAGAFRKTPPTSIRQVLDKKSGKQAKFDDFKDTKMPATEFYKSYKVGPKKKSN